MLGQEVSELVFTLRLLGFNYEAGDVDIVVRNILLNINFGLTKRTL